MALFKSLCNIVELFIIVWQSNKQLYWMVQEKVLRSGDPT